MANRHTREQTNKQNRIAIVLLALAFFGLAGSLWGFIHFTPANRNKVTLCPVSGALASRKIIIVDRTDPWNGAQSHLLALAIKHAAAELRPNARFSLIAFDGYAKQHIPPLFDRCHPGTGAQANPIISTPSRIDALYRQSFSKPLERAVAKATRSARSNKTNLIEFISNVAAEVKYDGWAQHINLIIYSDMAENSESFSTYRAARRRNFTKRFVQVFDERMANRLKGLSLTVYQLTHKKQPSRHRDLIRKAWSAAFNKRNVTFAWRSF